MSTAPIRTVSTNNSSWLPPPEPGLDKGNAMTRSSRTAWVQYPNYAASLPRVQKGWATMTKKRPWPLIFDTFYYYFIFLIIGKTPELIQFIQVQDHVGQGLM
jgi:hypothetical protein